MDLAAINIQRGRDHGIPPYTHWRVPCGLTPINTWQEFANVVGPESARRISHAYHSVHDIDLFVGGIAERPVVGGLVGPTFACIIAQQFSNSRKGDRFWYENGGFESSFTPAQLHVIRRVSFASVLCRVVGGGTFQPHIFLPPDLPDNKRVPCGVPPLADFDISPWLEQDPFASLPIVQQIRTSTRPPTFKPQPIPDRVFDIMQLETKAPVNTDLSIKDSKVGFPNRQPPQTAIRDQQPIVKLQKPHIEFVPTATSIKPQISDKLDLKRKGSQGHITKQKPVPQVNNKLDKNNNKNDNRHDSIQSSTRRTIIVNNIPIELRNAGLNTSKPNKAERTKLGSDNQLQLKPRLEDTKQGTDKMKIIKQQKNETKTATKQGTEQQGTAEQQTTKADKDRKTQKSKTKHKATQGKVDTSVDGNFNNKTAPPLVATDKQNEVILKIMNITKEFQNSELKHVTFPTIDFNGSDIDPMLQTTPHEHKRVQRKLLQATLTEQIKDKTKLTTLKELVDRNNTVTLNNRTADTKAPKPSRVAIRPVELRQYQSRPSHTKPPQKVIVDSQNGDNQYEIEINIRQTNKNQKPLHTTPQIVDYTSGYKPPNYVDRFGNGYADTTPIYAYYQPIPTQVAPLTQNQNQRTKPPTIILVNEQDHERMATKQPGFLQSIAGWNLGTKRPFTSSIGFNDRPGQETLINSPHSTAQLATNYQNLRPHATQLAPPAGTTSFSQAGIGLVQASSTSLSHGSFGTITGFASANGADSTFSFNIRPKPDKSQQNGRPLNSNGGYGFSVPPPPPRNPWTNPHPNYAAGDLPYRENINTPFSTANSQTYYIRNKNGPQRKEALALLSQQQFADYDYLGRTLDPLSNVTSTEINEDKELDYEYDEDYGISPFVRKFNQDGYLRPEHMIATLFKTNNDTLARDFLNDTITEDNNRTPNDNYVLPMLNNNTDLPLPIDLDLPKPLLANNFTDEYNDTFAKHFNNDIFAEDNNNNSEDENENENIQDHTKTFLPQEHVRKRNRNKNKATSKGSIAFAPINILTKPER